MADLRTQAICEFVRRVFAERTCHGSALRDLLIERGLTPNADTLLAQLVERGVILRGAIATPTPSQSTFIGLQFAKHPGWVAGCREHYTFTPYPLSVFELRALGFSEAAKAIHD